MKSKIRLVIFTFLFIVSSCRYEKDHSETRIQISSADQFDSIRISDYGIKGIYKGPEFISNKDVKILGLKNNDLAHQFSNRVVYLVGNTLKKLYTEKKYSKVDLRKIKMATPGMDKKGDVEYSLLIPIIRVPKEEAMTGFEHCGGWDHGINKELEDRKKKLLTLTTDNNLYISDLMKTEEGLQEYWIQFRHYKYK